MKKQYRLILIISLIAAFAAIGCAGDDNNALGEGGPSNTDEKGTDTGTPPPPVCNINLMETFDAPIPTGWTIVGSSGSGSGTGTGTASGALDSSTFDSDKTWHHTTVEAKAFPLTDPNAEGMTGGYLTVAGQTNSSELLLSPLFQIGSCTTASVSFKHFFDDAGSSQLDRGELQIQVDGPPWDTIQTYNTAGGGPVTVDLSGYIAGGLSFQLGFYFADDGETSYGWSIDDVTITGAE